MDFTTTIEKSVAAATDHEKDKCDLNLKRDEVKIVILAARAAAETKFPKYRAC